MLYRKEEGRAVRREAGAGRFRAMRASEEQLRQTGTFLVDAIDAVRQAHWGGTQRIGGVTAHRCLSSFGNIEMT
ncbi:hypothetical protein [Mesorhizobium sp. ES1-4]|uniref:hypothetical protein n=1 Tax=Mesorhizobium sp. ES1-4 TaxID=2876627 RepID=UPI001CCA4C4B|nr:hypothetical protein [Mesorhizobium sp. ES1-4]MBZ9794524.1 hypothetical protein [Mesorhizobium sp. ES1-4]